MKLVPATKSQGKTAPASYDARDVQSNCSKCFGLLCTFLEDHLFYPMSGVTADNNSHNLDIQHNKANKLPQQVFPPVEGAFRRYRRISFVVICLDFIGAHRFSES